MKINIENKLNEKQTKELVSSFKRLVRFTYKYFDTIQNKDANDVYQLTLKFDNGNKFSIYQYNIDNQIIRDITYVNKYDEIMEKISLQQLMNICKYGLDIENHLHNNSKEIIIEAYFTEQSLDKFPIFKENDIGLEQKLKNIDTDIEAENIEVDAEDYGRD